MFFNKHLFLFSILLILFEFNISEAQNNYNQDKVVFSGSENLGSRIQQSNNAGAANSCCNEVEDLRLTLQEHNFQLEQSAKQTNSLQNKVKELTKTLQQREANVADLSANVNRLVSLSSNCTQRNFELQRETEGIRANAQASRSICQHAGSNLELVSLTTGRYYISNKLRLNWFEAMKFCKYHGLEVASIENAKENEALIAKALELGLPHNHRYILSGTDLGQEGHWFWSSTGQEILYPGWHRNQPDNHKMNQNCLTMWNLNNTIKWDDAQCDSKQFFICEMPSFCHGNA